MVGLMSKDCKWLTKLILNPYSSHLFNILNEILFIMHKNFITQSLELLGNQFFYYKVLKERKAYYNVYSKWVKLRMNITDH